MFYKLVNIFKNKDYKTMYYSFKNMSKINVKTNVFTWSFIDRKTRLPITGFL